MVQVNQATSLSKMRPDSKLLFGAKGVRATTVIRLLSFLSIVAFILVGVPSSHGALRSMKSKKAINTPLRSLLPATVAAPQFSVSPTLISVSSVGAANGLVNVVAENSDWGVSNVTPWITVVVTANRGSSNSILTYSVAPNTECANRVGVFFVKTQAVTVTQAGAVGSYSLSSASGNFNPNGGTSSVFLSANCSWTIQKDVSWITGIPLLNGNGNATIGYAVASNSSSSPRTGSIKVLDQNSAVQQTFTVTQDGAPPSHLLSSSNAFFSYTGGTSNVFLTALAGWSLQADVSWITSVSPLNGISSANISYTVQPNPNHVIRGGSIKVLDANSTVQQTLIISEAAAPISHSLSYTNAIFGPNATNTSVQLTATAPWTVQTDVGWITAISPVSGNGNAFIGFSIMANTNSISRMGSIKILSADSTVQQVLTITQGGAAGYFLSSTNASFTSSGGSSNVQLTASAGWIVQTDVGWISGLAPVSGSGNATINYTIAVNNNCGSRSGLVKILDPNSMVKQTVLVTQAGMPGNYTLSSSYLLFPSSGGRVTVNLAARCNWTAVSDVSWINAIIPSSGNTNATISYTVDSNTAMDGRSGYLRILDGSGVVQQTLRIVQSGDTPVFWVSPTLSTFPAIGGSSNVALEANSTWVAQADVSWISGINPSSGSGSDLINYIVGPNTNSVSRSGSIKFFDANTNLQDTLTIYQAGTGVAAPMKYVSASGSYIWSSTLGSTNDDSARAVVVDEAGSVLAAGSINGSIYLEKISAVGKPLWSKWLSGIGRANSIAVDEAGDIFLAGSFSGAVNFDSVLLSTSGDSDGFVSKYKADGVQVWAKSFGGEGDDSVTSIALNAENVVLTGSFTSSINFGETTGSKLTSAGAKDIFIATLSKADGHHIWSQRFGSTADDEATSVAIDLQGNLAISGSFNGEVGFGGNLFASEGSDAFVAMFSKSGAPLWSKQLGGSQNDYGSGVAVDGEGNIFVTASFEGGINIGGASFTATTESSSSFVAKFSGAANAQSGSHLWSKQVDAASASVAVDSKGNVAVCSDNSVTKFSSEGAQLWSKNFGSLGSNNSCGISHDANDNVLVAGSFSGSIDFGGGEQTATGGSDFLVLKLAP